MKVSCFLLAVFAPLVLSSAYAEDGYDLWLRYTPVEKPYLADYRAEAKELVSAAPSPTIIAARDELVRAITGMLGKEPDVARSVTKDGAILFGTPAENAAIAALHLPLDGLGDEAYLLRSANVDGHKTTVIAANSDVGVLYGTFAFLRLMQTRQKLGALAVASAPRLKHRVLDHWDNLDGTIERGYAGFSLWNWQKLPDYHDPRYTDYARANASIGINGVVLNNVNAQKEILTPLYIEKIAALADVFRPYGIKVYLSARFSAPIELGGLKTADPLDPAVKAWWQAKVDEIYKAVPDFGGFLVKANSEGQPGPQDYHRTHADGANMLADALAPHHGIVMWRAFVYSSQVQEDREKQAYDEFKPLDGQFRPNVLLQVKNGPIDFQPREPFHPLFGAMPKTPLMLELQITKEYLGLATSLVYLGPLYEEVLRADTYAQGKGSTVARVVDGSLEGHSETGMAGVANTGTDRNWCGSEFNQANWYVFGRLAWDPDLSARAIAVEWARQTFTNDPRFVEPAVDMMMDSREAAVDYMTPLGIGHQMATGHHYGPGLWMNDGGRPDWNPSYYTRADKNGIGVDRTATGSDAVAQYAPPVAAEYGSLDSEPDNLLLWFHHVPWDYRMKSGHTLWEELVAHYTQGVETVAQNRAVWETLKPYVDPQRFEETDVYLGIEEKEARWWRDASLAYWQSINGLPLPPGFDPPLHSLDYYKAIHYPYVPGHYTRD
jgi:alpha-glucuronidase